MIKSQMSADIFRRRRRRRFPAFGVITSEVSKNVLRIRRTELTLMKGIEAGPFYWDVIPSSSMPQS